MTKGMGRPALSLRAGRACRIVLPDCKHYCCSREICGSTELCIHFCLPVGHRVTPSGCHPFLPERHPAQTHPNRPPSGPWLHARVRGPSWRRFGESAICKNLIVKSKEYRGSIVISWMMFSLFSIRTNRQHSVKAESTCASQVHLEPCTICA